MTDAENIISVPVKVLSTFDSTKKTILNKKTKSIEKLKRNRRGFTAVISSENYKESLLLSKSKPKRKRQPKNPKKDKENLSQAQASVRNELKLQVPIQLIQCVQPIPFQMQSQMQTNQSFLAHSLSQSHLQMIPNVSTNFISSTIQLAQMPSTISIRPVNRQLLPNITTCQPTTIRPNILQQPKMWAQTYPGLVIRPINKETRLMNEQSHSTTNSF